MWDFLARLLHRRPAAAADPPAPTVWGALDAASEPFRRAFDAVPTPMALTDAGYRFVQVNRAFRELLGYTEPELALRPAGDLSHGDDLAEDLRLTAELFAGRLPGYQRQKRFLDATREPLAVDVTAVPLPDRAGRPLYQLLMAVDLRAMDRARETHEKLRLRLRRQQLLLDLVHDAVLVRDPQMSVVTYWSPGAHALYGWGPAEAVGRVSHRLLETRFPQGLADIEAALYRTGFWEGELVQRAANGGEVVVGSRWYLEAGDEAQPRAVVQVDTDRTAQRRAEADAAAWRERLERFAAPAAIGLCAIDRQGVCTVANDAAAGMLGYRSEELVGLNLHEAVHHHRPDGARYPPEQCPIFRTVLTGQGLPEGEEVLWRRDGTPLPVEFTTEPLLEGGACVGALVAFRDGTARLQTREALALHARAPAGERETRATDPTRSA